MAKNNDTEKQYLFDNPKNIKRLLLGFYICCIALVVIELFVERHTYHAWESVFGFYAIYGFVGCVFLVLASKVLRKLVMRDEDYYDRYELKNGEQVKSSDSSQQQSKEPSTESSNPPSKEQAQGGSQHVDD